MTPQETASVIYRLPFQTRALLDDIYDYVQAKAPHLFFGWSRQSMLTLFAHRLHRERLILRRDAEKEICGIGLWLRVPKDWDPVELQSWPDDANDAGELFVGLVADDVDTRKTLVLEFIRREPDALTLPLSALRPVPGKAFPEKATYDVKLLRRMLKDGIFRS